MDRFTDDVLEKMGGNGENRFYVYRLIDPRTYETFYVGKGCGNRVFQHAKEAMKMPREKEDDDESLKIRQIHDIISEDKEVIPMIHRWNMNKDEALEVEAALIDCYPGLSNIQSGLGNDYGVISAVDLQANLGAKEYDEPNEDYVIIKIKPIMISLRGGSLYEAVRWSWKANLDKAKNYRYVLAVVNGIVREIYEVTQWQYRNDGSGRIEFTGNVADGPISNIKGNRIPQKYRTRGAANPFIYKK